MRIRKPGAAKKVREIRIQNILTLVGRRKAGVPLLLRGILPLSAARSPLLRNAAEGAIWLLALYWRRTGAESTENRSGSPQSDPLPANELGSETNCWGGKEEAPGQMCDDGTKRKFLLNIVWYIYYQIQICIKVVTHDFLLQHVLRVGLSKKWEDWIVRWAA